MTKSTAPSANETQRGKRDATWGRQLPAQGEVKDGNGEGRGTPGAQWSIHVIRVLSPAKDTKREAT